MNEKIKEVIEKMRPYMNSHGGDLEYVNYEDNIVYIKLTGLCSSCPHQSETLQNGLFRALQAEVPEVKDLIVVDL